MEMKCNNSCICCQGKEGEERARKLLWKLGIEVQSPDWMGYKAGQFVCYEIKQKAEPFEPPPFKGHGLDKRQIELRRKLEAETGIQTFLIVFDSSDNKIYGQWLEGLEMGEKFETKNGVIIYPLASFKELGEYGF